MSFLGLSFRPSASANSKHFRLHPGACLVTLLAIFILVKLGLWQIDRGQEKQAIIDQHAAAQAEGPRAVSQSDIIEQSLRQDTRVSVQGEFSPADYVLIDNQTSHGRVGYHVVALLRTEGITQRIPVNLGWIPIPGRRDILPDVELPEGSVTVTGRINLPAERPFLLREQQFETQLPQRIQYLELTPLSEAIATPLPYFSVLLDESADFGFVREWPVVISEPHRHYAYAVQWFGLAIAALVVFIFASRRKRTHSKTSLQENNNDKQ